MSGNAYRSWPTAAIKARTIASVTGSRSVNAVPFPGSVWISIDPPRARIRVIATSMPTPRPDTSVTSSAVVNPGRASTRSSWSSDSVSTCGPTTPSRFALSRMAARSIPRPSSVIVMATLERSRTAASTIWPSGFFFLRLRSAGGSMPWSTAFRSR